MYAQTDSVQALIDQSKLALQKDNRAESLVWAKKAFEQAHAEGNTAKIGNASIHLAEIYRVNDSLKNAEEIATAAVKLFGKTEQNERLARSLSILGRIKQDERNFAAAMEHYTKALSIYNQKLNAAEAEKNLDLKAFILERMGVVLSNQKQHDKAESYLVEAYTIFEKMDNKRQLVITSTSLGNNYFWLKSYEIAQKYYEKAHILAKELGLNTGRSLNNLGIIANRNKHPEQAIEYYKQAIEQYKKTGNKDLIAQTQVNIAELYHDLGNYQKAIEFAQQGTEGLIALKKTAGVIEGYETLVKSFINIGDTKNALEYQKAFIALKDSAFVKNLKNDVSEWQIKFETEKKNKEIQLLNQENKVRALQLKQQELDLTNQKLLTEKDQKAILLLKQTKQLQEADLALMVSDLDKEKQIGDNKNIQLTVYQQDIKVKEQDLKVKEQEAIVQAKSNELLRGAILGLLFFGLLGLLFFRYRQRIVREREHVAQLRAEEAAQRLWQETELRALRSQMNPHFIFNCLNSIKSLTLKNETDKASIYITKFSRLMRQVLENSRSEWISLNQELETLSLYMDMEKLRFQSKFDFKLDVSPDLSTHAVKVPPMLVQPYVENAIWHGLMHKEGFGKVVVSLTEEDDNQLIIKVIDDGIGRKRSAELKSKSATENKSFGLQITSERMDILNQYYHINATSHIKDLYDELGNPTGTEVTLTIPM